MKPFRLLGWFCAILCGVALTWWCAAAGYARVWFTECRLRSRVPAAMARVRVVQEALLEYSSVKHRWPTPADLIDGGYLHPRDLVDPWGTTIFYGPADAGLTVISAGPDRTFGNEDDVEGTD